MSNHTKDKSVYVLLFLSICLIPNLLFYFFKWGERKYFYANINESHRICVERAKEDSAYVGFCDEIRTSAKDTFRSSSSLDNFYLLIFPPILFVFLMTTLQLKRQVEELKEKINE